MALRIQKPVEPNAWLYQDRGENDRYFTDVVYLGKHEPEWAQCTQSEREEWEKSREPLLELPSESKEVE